MGTSCIARQVLVVLIDRWSLLVWENAVRIRDLYVICVSDICVTSRSEHVSTSVDLFGWSKLGVESNHNFIIRALFTLNSE